MTSVSLVAWKIEPSRSSSRRSSAALVMLPLCATAICPLLHATESGWAFSRTVSPARGIAGVPDGQFARQLVQHIGREDIRDMTHLADAMDFAPVGGCDARAFLSPVLQSIQSEIGEICRFGVAVDGENAALFVEFVE